MNHIVFLYLAVILCSCQNESCNHDLVSEDDSRAEDRVMTDNKTSIDNLADSSYYHNQKLKGAMGSGIVRMLKDPIHVIDSIFTEYTQYRESTTSDHNKTMMTNALNQLDTGLSRSNLLIIINVWMYFDPTDYPTRLLTERVLEHNGKNSIQAIEDRIKNRRACEEPDESPYSELTYLLKKLKE